MNSPLKHTPVTLDFVAFPNRTPEDIAQEYLAAKKALNLAQAALDALAEELVDQVDGRQDGDEGSKTYGLDGFKVEVKRSMNRKPAEKTSIDAIAALKLGELTPLKIETKLDETGLKYLKSNEPAIYARIAPHIVAKPAKVSVTVTRTE
jgi:hypothetical protein